MGTKQEPQPTPDKPQNSDIDELYALVKAHPEVLEQPFDKPAQNLNTSQQIKIQNKNMAAKSSPVKPTLPESNLRRNGPIYNLI